MRQTNLNLSDQSIEEIDNAYKKKLFIEALKDGKLAQRRNLFKTIFYLAGHPRCFKWSSTLDSDMHNYTKYCDISTGHVDNLKTILNSENLIFRLKRYLKNHFTMTKSRSFSFDRIQIYFNKEDVMWSLIDHDLLAEHPLNTERRKNGFVYIKNYHHGIRYDINRY